MHPHVSYSEHWRALVDHARLNRLPAALPHGQARFLATVRLPHLNHERQGLALFLPAGLAIRTTQIVGSFCMINGIAHYLG